MPIIMNITKDNEYTRFNVYKNNESRVKCKIKGNEMSFYFQFRDASYFILQYNIFPAFACPENKKLKGDSFIKPTPLNHYRI